MSGRGVVTPEIVAKAKELLGIESISTRELRLIPYVQYCIVNNENIDIRRVNEEERVILSTWRQKGWITGGASQFETTKQFWDAMSELLWLAYVEHD